MCIRDSVSSFGEGLAVWVLLSQVDRDRRAERVGFGVIEYRLSAVRVQVSAAALTRHNGYFDKLNTIAKPLQNVHSHSRSAAAAAAVHAAVRHQGSACKSEKRALGVGISN